MGRQRLYHCGECDDWKSDRSCPDCGTPCTVYVRAVLNHPNAASLDHSGGSPLEGGEA